MTEVIDGEVVGQELAPLEPAAAPTTLFRTDDPVEVLERATVAATALARVLEERKLYAQIQGKKHVLVEGWLTLGAMLGVTPVCTWTRKLENGWEARVEARTLDGRVVGAAEAECLKAEGRWRTADDYAIRSMAQTRATSKALGSALRFVVTLAGFSGTPAEEMPSEPQGGRSGVYKDNGGPRVSDKQVKALKYKADRAGIQGETLGLFLRHYYDVGAIEELPRSGVEFDLFEKRLREPIPTGESDLPAPDTEGLTPDPDAEIEW